MQNIASNQASAEVPINENFQTLIHLEVYGKKQSTTSGLTWGYWGGRWGGFLIADATLALTASATNYIVVARATGVISTSTAITNWDNTANYLRVYKLTTGTTSVTATEDHRAGNGGVHGGFQDNTASAIANTPAGNIAAVTVQAAINELDTEKAALTDITGGTQAGSFTTLAATEIITASKGIAFPATQVPSANANTLDDYEEGSWTPVFTTSGGGFSATYVLNNGRYVKVGTLVTVWGDVVVSTKSASGTGYLLLSGLPFLLGPTVTEFGGVVGMSYAWATNPCSHIQPLSNSTNCILNYNGTNANCTGADVASGSYFRFSVTYPAAS